MMMCAKFPCKDLAHINIYELVPRTFVQPKCTHPMVLTITNLHWVMGTLGMDGCCWCVGVFSTLRHIVV